MEVVMIKIKETWINKTEGYSYGDSGEYETFADYNEKGRLFKHLQKEFGRCKSAMYIDHSFYGALKIGWVFEKIMRYEDANEKYLQETWVEITNMLAGKA
jgi:hypothetical protein